MGKHDDIFAYYRIVQAIGLKVNGKYGLVFGASEDLNSPSLALVDSSHIDIIGIQPMGLLAGAFKPAIIGWR